MSGFQTHKGLQKPLVFKSFKGKYIYWGGGCILLGFILCVIAIVSLGTFYGVAVFAFTVVGGLMFIGNKQKKGLHSKTKSKGIYIVKPIHKFNKDGI